MRFIYSTKPAFLKQHLLSDERIIYKEKDFLISSEEKYTEIELENKNKLFLWGQIYAIVQPNGTYLPVGTNAEGKTIIKSIFTEPDLNRVIKNIEGDFIGCLIKNDQKLVIFADSYNRRDIFYCQTNNDSIIASTDLSALIPFVKKCYDQAALANVLCIFGGYAPKKHTIYKNIRRLGVGQRLVIQQHKLIIEKLPFTPTKIGNFDTQELSEYSALLEDAVRIRASNSCNWVYMTGGWDSSTIATLLVKQFGPSRVKTLTGKIALSNNSKETNIFEAERAKKIAEHFCIDSKLVPWDLTTDYAVECWQKLALYFRKNHIYAKNACDYYFLSNYLRQHANPKDIVFSGEISDGAHSFGFACSRTIQEHPVLEFRAYADKMAAYLFGPTFFRSVLDGSYLNDAVYKLLRSRFNGCVFEDENGQLSEYERKTKFIASCFIRTGRIPFYSQKNHKPLTDNGAEMYESEMFKNYLNECVDNLEPDNLYSWILYLYNSFHWQGSTIKSIAETARYNNFSLRLPYWDIRLQNFLSRMPENWGRGLELKPVKYPLKQMLENRKELNYPLHLQNGARSFLNDVNPNFSLHAEFVYRSALAPHFKKRLKDYPFEEILDKRYFNLDYCRKLADDYIAGVEVKGLDLSYLNHLILFCWVGWY